MERERCGSRIGIKTVLESQFPSRTEAADKPDKHHLKRILGHHGPVIDSVSRRKKDRFQSAQRSTVSHRQLADTFSELDSVFCHSERVRDGHRLLLGCELMALVFNPPAGLRSIVVSLGARSARWIVVAGVAKS